VIERENLTKEEEKRRSEKGKWGRINLKKGGQRMSKTNRRDVINESMY